MTKNERLCEQCLTEMFKRVGLEFPNEELTSQDDWYMQHTWTQAESDDFKKWMLKLLKKERMIRPEHQYAMFNLMWGWKVKEEV